MFIVCLVLVHCRVGSLEMLGQQRIDFYWVHCRVGSLEMLGIFVSVVCWVHCRVGSSPSLKKIEKRFFFYSKFIQQTYFYDHNDYSEYHH